MHAAYGGFARALPGAAGPAAHRRGKYIALGGLVPPFLLQRRPDLGNAAVLADEGLRSIGSAQHEIGSRIAVRWCEPRRIYGNLVARQRNLVVAETLPFSGALRLDAAPFFRLAPPGFDPSVRLPAAFHVGTSVWVECLRRIDKVNTGQHDLVDDDVIDALLFCRQLVIIAATLRDDKSRAGNTWRRWPRSEADDFGMPLSRAAPAPAPPAACGSARRARGQERGAARR
ncbi:hypothetical protein AB7M49_006743 [Bradyrhizobium elkanii]|jgi:hypothetical protein